MVLSLLLRPIDDLDIFTQIKLGELILEQRTLFLSDSFTYTLSGKSVPPVGWLAQFIFALLYRFFSWPGVQFVHVLLYSSAFIIAGISPTLSSAKKDGNLSLFSIAAAVLLGFLVSFSNSSVRPQSLAIIAFSSLLHITQSNWLLRTKFLLLIPVLLVWQNSHPSVMIGVITMAVIILSSWAAAFKSTDVSKPWGLSGLFVMVFLAQLATPMGYQIFDVSARNALVSREWMHVGEWVPPWHKSVLGAMTVFWIALALSVYLMIKLKNKLRLIDVTLCTLFISLSFYASRFGVFWALTMVPIWARWIEQAKPTHLFSWRGDLRISIRTLVTTFVIGIIIIGFLVPVLRPSIVDQKSIPVQGIKRLKSVLTRGRIYNNPEYGGPLIFAGYPDWQVALDGRLYLYDKEIWKEYYNAVLGNIPLQELVNKHQPDAFFLHPQFHSKLISTLSHSHEWREFYSDKMCIIFLPT